MFNHSGASGHSSFQLLVSIQILSTTSIFSKLPTTYKGIHEFRADNQIEKLQILLITVQSGFIQSDHKNISFTSMVFQSVLSMTNDAELSTTIVSGIHAFQKIINIHPLNSLSCCQTPWHIIQTIWSDSLLWAWKSLVFISAHSHFTSSFRSISKGISSMKPQIFCKQM